MLRLLKKSVLLGAVLTALLLWAGAAMLAYADTCRVQMSTSGYDPMGGENVTLPGVNPWTRLGQKLVILDREVLSIGYHVRRVGLPSGNVTLSIYDTETDAVIFSEVWGDASELPVSGTSGYCEVTLDPAIRINREVRLCVEYYGGNTTDHCVAAYYTGDKITGECYTNYRNQWHDIGEAEDGSYCYTYTCEVTPEPNGDDVTEGPNIRLAIIAGGVVCLAGIAYLVRDKQRNT